jgi:uncharacterized protein (DUF302 family)
LLRYENFTEVATKFGEVLSQFIAQRKLAGFVVPTGIDVSAALHLQCEGNGPSQIVSGESGHGLEQSQCAKTLGE